LVEKLRKKFNRYESLIFYSDKEYSTASLILEISLIFIKFWKLFLKPGKPFAFGLINKKIPYFGLPGNPVSAAITFIQLVWPALQKLEGITNIEFPLRIKVKLNSDLKRRKGRPELLRGKLIVNEEGELIADISEEQSSSKISSISNSDLLIEIPSEIDFCQKGNLLWAQLLKNNFL